MDKDIVNTVGELLRQEIPRKDVRGYIERLEAVRYDLAEATARAMELVYVKRKQMLWPKDAEKGLTELDRTTRLNGDVAMLERDYAFLKRLETLVDDRLNLALTLLEL